MIKQITLGLALASSLSFGAVKTYQVTGPVLDVKDDMIVVQKGKDKWEIQKDSAIKSEVKVGDKVTIEYRMIAVSVESKAKKK
jgi:RNase P/RNase MRP subunit p29